MPASNDSPGDLPDLAENPTIRTENQLMRKEIRRFSGRIDQFPRRSDGSQRPHHGGDLESAEAKMGARVGKLPGRQAKMGEPEGKLPLFEPKIPNP